jgi:DNA-binding LacI/PurR family transcriptional regulator
MDRLGYHPHALARGLARSTTGNLGLILPNSKDDLFLNPFFIEAMRGIGIESQSRGYNLMFSFSNNEDEEVGFITHYIQSRWVDGIILLTSRENDVCIEYLMEKRFPFVVVGRPEDTEGVNWVDNDNIHAVEEVTRLLFHRGCRRPAFLGGPGSFTFTRDRLSGYRRALETRGLPENDLLVELVSDFSEEAGLEGMRRILERDRPDGVVAADDYLGFGAIRALKEADLGGTAVIGFNNTLRGRYQSPSLTSVDVNPLELGRNATEILINDIHNGASTPKHRIVETYIIERETTSGRKGPAG